MQRAFYPRPGGFHAFYRPCHRAPVLVGLSLVMASMALSMGTTASVAGEAAPVASDQEPVLTEPAREWSLSLHWENDTFAGTDRFYTDGVSLAVTHTGPSWLDPVADLLPWGEGRRTVGYDAGQIMVTPEKTGLPIPDPNDRPYAGILWVGLALHVEKARDYHGLKFITGMVGPASLAKETQQFVHELLGQSVPQGWDYQLHDEPVLNLVYEYRHKFHLLGRREGWSVEALPMGNAMLGNVSTQVQVGGQLRMGWHIPNDFGTTLMRGMVHLPPPRRDPNDRRWGLYAFGGGGLNLVARNITLDGNTWRSSRSVDKKWFVPAAEFGVAVDTPRVLASFSYVFWSEEFKNQPEPAEFGAFSCTIRF